jgi:hypothetical protein
MSSKKISHQFCRAAVAAYTIAPSGPSVYRARSCKYYQSYAQRKVSRVRWLQWDIFQRKLGVIKGEVMSAVTQFYNINRQGLQFLNQALVVLIPKKPNAEKISDFRPISLIHSFAKIISKMMANRLAPELGKLISCSQNAFIKRRSIQENFMDVQ